MTKPIEYTITIPATLAGMRLDQALSSLLPDFSRTQIQEWIKNSNVFINQTPITKPRYSVSEGEIVQIKAKLKIQPAFEAEAITLSIVYEDEDILIINKPAGMVVHPAAGNPNQTLLNALLHHAPDLKDLPRAGIIHRLDKDTSGLLIVAKTPMALTHLTHQLKKRSITRIYQTIIAGILMSGQTIDAPIDRHPIHRKRMTVSDTGKPAITHFRVIERYRAYTRVKVQLETGRTHQIRVHMAHIKHPILGDPVYGRLQLPKGATPALVDALRGFKRQALHAIELGFLHPRTQKPMIFQAPLPEDMQTLIDILKKDTEVST